MKPFILAGSYQKADYYLKSNQLDFRQYRIIADPMQLKGLYGYTVVMLPCAVQRRDFHVIWDELQTHKATVLTEAEHKEELAKQGSQ